MPDAFSKVEVCSPGELEICKKLNLDPQKIIFSGVNKRLPEIKEAIEYGVAVVTAESEKHLRDTESCAKELGITVPVILRLSEDSQFGINEERLISLVRDKALYPHLDFKGLHFFTGTGKKKAKVIQKEMDRLKKVINRLMAENTFVPELVEYGPGLAIEYFSASDQESEKTEMELLESVAPALVSFEEEMSSQIPNFKMTIEMGRFFSAPCGFYITTVEDIKQNEEINYAIVDGGLHQLKYDGQLQGMKIPVMTHISNPDKDYDAIGSEHSAPWTICGSLCTTADVLTRNVPLGKLEIGDFLVFHRTGAYSVTEGMALFLSRDLPSVYLNDKNDNLVQLRESIETAALNTTK